MAERARDGDSDGERGKGGMSSGLMDTAGPTPRQPAISNPTEGPINFKSAFNP